jgi:hypothetical protein
VDFVMVFFVGILALATLQVVVPLAVQLADGLLLWVFRRPQARLHKWRSLNPVEQNLQRASHGAALVGLVLLAVVAAPDSITAFVRSHAPAGMSPGLLLLPPLAYGLVRFLAGVRRSWGISDGLLAVRAVVKIVAGTVLLFYIPYLRVIVRSAAAMNDFATLRELALVVLVPLAAYWCIVTGVVRLVLAISGGFRFRRNVPQPVPMPHGESRLAGPGEGRRAMQGQGQLSRMDGRKF